MGLARVGDLTETRRFLGGNVARFGGTTNDTNHTKKKCVVSNGGFDAILFNVVDFAKNPVVQGPLAKSNTSAVVIDWR